MAEDSTYHILVVEDDPKVASIIQAALETQDHKVQLAFDGKLGLNLFNQQKFDLIIVDVMLPDISGFEVCSAIRSGNQSIPVLFLTALGTLENKIKGFNAGADDYLVKPFEILELQARVRAMLRRNKKPEEKEPEEFPVLKFDDLELDLATRQARRQGRIIDLTQKEFQLLELFMRNPRRVIAKSEIAENVWEITFDTGTNIIEVYVNYLRNKIDKPFDHHLIHTVKGMGYIMKAE